MPGHAWCNCTEPAEDMAASLQPASGCFLTVMMQNMSPQEWLLNRSLATLSMLEGGSLESLICKPGSREGALQTQAFDTVLSSPEVPQANKNIVVVVIYYVNNNNY